LENKYGYIIEQLEGWIDKKRLKHSIGVSRTAAKLAAIYGADVEKAELAGLLHDCAKCLSYEEMQKLCMKFNLSLDPLTMEDRALMHGPLGSVIAREYFGIEDKIILEAIFYHTIGKKGMNLFEKILYLADYIEPGRRFAGIDEIRRLAFTDLNRGLLKGLELTIRRVLDSGKKLHIGTVETRNELLAEITGLKGGKANLK
jgi:predicted HD superfamily hydrolase involved in NAD metabolism